MVGNAGRGWVMGNNHRKLTNEQVRNIKYLLSSGATVLYIANLYGVSITTINKIKTGRTYREVTVVAANGGDNG